VFLVLSNTRFTRLTNYTSKSIDKWQYEMYLYTIVLESVLVDGNYGMPTKNKTSCTDVGTHVSYWNKMPTIILI